MAHVGGGQSVARLLSLLATQERAMRVLLVGLGDVARKAYLPLLAAWPGLELHLATRQKSVLRQAGESYRIPHLYRSAAEALRKSTFDAAFVHAATEAHVEIVELLLEAGVHVFVDKPLAYRFDEAARLVSLSEREGRLLMVGFNRRYAPDYLALRDQPRDFCLMQKHRWAEADQPRRTVFDDFVHVVDTLLFLAPAPAKRVSIDTVMEDGLLRSVTLVLASDRHVAVGCMHRDSGLDEERLDVIADGHKRSVLNLSETREQAEGTERLKRRPDWVSVGRQRGFEAMCADFLDGVRAGRPTAAHEILETHRVCEEIVCHAEAMKEA
jgi:virulence factor